MFSSAGLLQTPADHHQLDTNSNSMNPKNNTHQNYESIRKIPHLNPELSDATNHCKQNQATVQTISPTTPSTNTHNNSTQKTQPASTQNQICQILSTQSMLTHQHKTLMRMQHKIDQHLSYIGSCRNKKKGQFFSNIQKSLLKSCHIILEISHLKKIMQLDANCYHLTQELNRDRQLDIFLMLPQDHVQFRQFDFKQKLLAWVEIHGKEEIPKMNFPFQEVLSTNNVVVLQKKRVEREKQLKEIEEQGSCSFRTHKMIKDPQFMQIKIEELKNKEQQMRIESEKSQFERNKWGRHQLSKIIHNLQMIFSSKKAVRLSKSTVFSLIVTQSQVRQSAVEWALGVIEKKGEGYLKTVQGPKGMLFQVNVPSFSQSLNKILSCYS